MTIPTKINYKIYQGSTFTQVLRWESYIKNYASINSIQKSAPTVIEATGHGMPVGWRFKISNVQGMKEINTDEYLIASDVTADTITINLLNSVGYSTYTNGGVIEYNVPKNLIGVTARMQVREKLSSGISILELTTENGGIVLDNTFKTITIKISAAQTTDLTLKSYVYSLELLEGQVVTQLIKGNLSLDFEVTR